MTDRMVIETYKAVEMSSNSVVVIKAIKQRKETLALQNELESFMNWESSFIVQYLNHFEMEKKDWVQRLVLSDRIGCDGVL
mgnify:CR=1 FL=1